MSQTQVTLRSKLGFYVTFYYIIGFTVLTAFACEIFGCPTGNSLRRNAENNDGLGAS